MNYLRKVLSFFKSFSQQSVRQKDFVKLKTLRGMKDLSPPNCFQQKKIISVCSDICRRFLYREIQTPIMENALVFSKTLGVDIVHKELYQFQDKSGQWVALRPEGTAGVVRFLNSLENRQNQRSRFFYSGPMFRYERPQKGRLRQFYQFGVEFFGETAEYAELELILMAGMILKELNILPQTRLIINSIGDSESRDMYREKLVQYLKPLRNQLSVESQERLLRNPLRILDSKSKQDKEVLKKAPRPIEYLNQYSKNFYQNVLSLLKENQISFHQDDFLVRGLDYYSHTVFEWVSDDLGAQSAVLAGGRYDGLVSMMGGANCPAVGWACGLDRMALLCSEKSLPPPDVGVLSVHDSMDSTAQSQARLLREEGFSVYLPEKASFSKQMKKIHQQNCVFAVILGSDEWKAHEVSLKEMNTGKQIKISKDSLVSYLKQAQRD